MELQAVAAHLALVYPLMPSSRLAIRLIYGTRYSVAKSVNGTRKKRGPGRPRTGAESIHLRLVPEIMKPLDGWRRNLAGRPSRPEAIRRLLVSALAAVAKNPR